METETCQLNDALARATIDAVDENRIRPDVTIPVVAPFSCQCVIAVPFGKGLAISEQLQHFFQDGFEQSLIRSPGSRL